MLNQIYQNLDPIALQLGPLSIRWYGIAYVLGFVFFALVVSSVSKRWKVRIDADSLFTILFCGIIGVIIGARLGYVLFYGDGYYLQHPLEIFLFSQGGMSFHGGLVGALVAGIFAAKLCGIPYMTLVDLGVIAAPIGLFFGRCANFINGELWGAPTDLPWGVVFGGTAGSIPRHPSQLYEALLEGVIIFVVLFALSRKNPPRPRGTFFGIFLIMYGTFRFLIEFVRQPDAQLGYLWGGWLTMGQVLSVPLVLVGVGVLIWVGKTKLPQCGLQNDTDDVSLSGETDKGGTMALKFYKCMHCGNVAIKTFDAGVPMVCCGDKMTLLEPNTTDAATEKHVPVATVEGNIVNVVVGSVEHPMAAEHYITFICLETKKGFQVAELTPEDQPKASFAVAPGDEAVAVYEHCNLHGLWKADL